MTVKIEVTRVTADTGGGTQDITISGFGTPKAALFILSQGVTDGTPENNLRVSLGFTDGTNQFTAGTASDQGVSSTNCSRRNSTDRVIELFNGATTDVAVASFSSWITDGVRINWNVTPVLGYQLTVILFGGSTLSAQVDTINLNNLTTVQSYSGASFQPEIIFCVGSATNIDTTESAYGIISYGLCVNTGTIKQYAFGQREQDAISAGNPSSHLRNDASLIIPTTTGGRSYQVQISHFSANGFNYQIPFTGAADNVMGVLMLAVDTSFDLVAVDSATSTGNSSKTGLAFEPGFVYQGLNALTSYNSGSLTANAGPFGISTFDRTNEFCNSWATEDGASATDTQSLSDDQAINFDTDAGVDMFDATFSSFNSDGWTLNYTVADATTRKWFALAIETSASSTPVSNTFQIPLHILLDMASTGQININNRLELSNTLQIPLHHTLDLSKTHQVNLSNLLELSSQKQIVIQYINDLSIVSQVNYAHELDLSKSSELNFDHYLSVSNTSQVPLSYLLDISDTSIINTGYTLDITNQTILNVFNTLDLSNTFIKNLDYLLALSRTFILNESYILDLSTAFQQNVESILDLSNSFGHNISNLLNISQNQQINLSNLLELSNTYILNVTWQADSGSGTAVQSTHIIPLSYGLDISVENQMTLEYALELLKTNQFNFSNELDVNQSSGIIITNLQGISTDGILVPSWYGQFSKNFVYNISSQQDLSNTNTTLISHLLSVSQDQELAGQWLRLVESENIIPVTWKSEQIFGSSISIVLDDRNRTWIIDSTNRTIIPSTNNRTITLKRR